MASVTDPKRAILNCFTEETLVSLLSDDVIFANYAYAHHAPAVQDLSTPSQIKTAQAILALEQVQRLVAKASDATARLSIEDLDTAITAIQAIDGTRKSSGHVISWSLDEQANSAGLRAAIRSGAKSAAPKK